MQTATIVKIISCTNDGGLSPFGFVDVLPLVSQIDGAGIAVPHTTVFSLPYFRVQGGANAVIIDPQPGDLGIALFASRDITNVVSTQAQAVPASRRIFDWADGMYLGGLLNGTPSQYIQFDSAGITIKSPGTVTITAANIVLNGPVAQSGGDVTVQDDLLAGTNAISSVNHMHTSEAEGSPTSPPIP